jgi:hypothetical protein
MAIYEGGENIVSSRLIRLTEAAAVDINEQADWYVKKQIENWPTDGAKQ